MHASCDNACSYGGRKHHIYDYTGPPEAPLDVVVDVVSSESVNVYWSPPFTLHGVPILHYTVNVVSQGTLTEQINTNETHITLERPCTSTTYHISGWNEVGEGSAAVYGEIYLLHLQFHFDSFSRILCDASSCQTHK